MAPGGGSGLPGAAGGTTSLLEEWLQKFATDGAQAPVGADPSAKTREIKEKLKEELKSTWENLKSRLEGQEAWEIRGLCFDNKEWTEKANSNSGQYVRDLCTALAEIKYFISGVWMTRKKAPGTGDNVEIEKGMDDAKIYSRCIVGAVALSTIYGDHCKLDDVIRTTEKEVDQKLEAHRSTGAQLNKCKGIDRNALLLGKSILQDEMKNWSQAERQKGMESKGSQGSWKLGKLWYNRVQGVCPQIYKGDGTKVQEQRKGNAEHMRKFLKVGDDRSITSGQATVADVLGDDNMKLSADKLTEVLSKLVGSDGKVDITNMDKLMEQLNKETETTT
ncbi:SICAvar, type I (fragment), partial [Plasmodium knowlesi strain H]